MSMGMGGMFPWLLRASWQAAVLVGLVLVVQGLLGKRLSASWRHSLWLLVVLRLVLPVSPHSAVSVFNTPLFAPRAPSPATQAPSVRRIEALSAPTERVAIATPAEVTAVPAFQTARELERPARSAVAIGTVEPRAQTALAKATAALPSLDLWKWAALLWLAGAALLGLRILGQNLVFARHLRRGEDINDAGVRDLFAACKALFGIGFAIRLVETDAVASPALYGWFRPKLLLPAGMLARFSRRELRYVFLHELAHVKRRDMGVHWLATGLKVLHWFNPVLWFAFRRMAADREMACDELALGHAAEGERRPYGETILKLLESCARPVALPGVMGLLEDKDQMTRRITMIAGFKRHPRWSLLALAVVAGLGLVTLTDAQSKDSNGANSVRGQSVPAEQGTAAPRQARPDFVGRVTAGQVVPEATVFIYTAGPKTGTSTFCPSCYPDCQKHAKADAQGGFKLESLDPQLLFRILVVAKGYKPKFVAKVDPAKGPVAVELEPIASGEVSPDRSLQGKVVGLDGRPVYGAVVEAHGIRKKNGIGTMFGTLPGVDPLAVTDEAGDFLLTAKEPFEMLDVRVEARGFAHKGFNQLPSGSTVQRLTLTEGGSLTGRVVCNGKPLSGITVGLAGAERGAEQFVGHFEVGTDDQGRFLFLNLPPEVDYFIYGMMGSLKKYGALPQQPVHAGKDGSKTDVGDLTVGSGHRLAGRVVLADGQPVPGTTRLLVGRESAWDSMQLTLDPDGRFEATAIPNEALSLSVRVPGYRVSSRNASFDRMNPFQLVGRVEHDVTNLVFLLEKGKDLNPEFGANLPSSAWPQNRPLRGAEGTTEHSDQWSLGGEVRDSQTREPLKEFRITPGNVGQMFERIFWDRRNAAQGTNGSFAVYLDQKFSQPALKVEADGYLPARFTVLPESQTNLQFTLQKGTGPSGRVLLPDGKTGAAASLTLLCAGEQDARLAADGHLRAFHNHEGVQIADPDGSFSFAPELEMQTVVAVAEEGFKRVSVQELATNSNVVLQPWGQIKGVLHRAGGAGTNEDLDLAFQGDSSYFLELHAKTDDQGRFQFDRVPPGPLVINGRTMLGANGWTSDALKQFELKPGQTLELTIDAPARPAAPRNWTSPMAVRKPTRKAGPGPKGIVLSPEGRPLEGAEVALLVKGQYLSLGRAALAASEARGDGLVVHSAMDGSFSLPAEEGATGVVVVDLQGFAQVSLADLQSSPRVTLQAWGRIEGTLHISRELGTNEMVTLEQNPFGVDGFDSNDHQARTDDHGRFVLTFVPPGERRLARMISAGKSAWTYGPATTINVKAGGVTQVNLGGTGRTVVGKVHLSDAATPVNWTQGQAILHTTFPTNMFQATWRESAEGRAFMRSAQAFSLKLAADGSFRAEEVLPGKYELHIALTRTANPASGPADYIGIFRQEVVIPKPANPEDDSPLDLGTLAGKLEPMPPMPVGVGGSTNTNYRVNAR